MVFTNLECWAMGSGDEGSENGRIGLSRGVGAGHLDPFNPRQVVSASSICKISNGYYGYSYLPNANEFNNNNNNNIIMNNNNEMNGNAVCDPNNNENNNNIHNRNYVNGMNFIMKEAETEENDGHYACGGAHAHDTFAHDATAATAAGTVNLASASTGIRCLKRAAALNDQQQQFVGGNVEVGVANHHYVQQNQQQFQGNLFAGNSECSAAKRMRVAADNDDFSAAHYFNDFFTTLGRNGVNYQQNNAMDVEMQPNQPQECFYSVHQGQQVPTNQQNNHLPQMNQIAPDVVPNAAAAAMQQNQQTSVNVNSNNNIGYQDNSTIPLDIHFKVREKSSQGSQTVERLNFTNLKSSLQTSSTLANTPQTIKNINESSDISRASNLEVHINPKSLSPSDLYEMYVSLHGGGLHNAFADIEEL